MCLRQYRFDGIAVPIARLIDRIKACSQRDKIKERICEIKFGKDLQAYKTGSVNGVKKRIELFTEGVQEILDGR